MSYNVLDIANELLWRAEDVGEPYINLKLQKMLYYEQGFHLAYFGTPLFDDNVEAWKYGPVVPVVYDKYKDFDRQQIKPDSGRGINFKDPQEKALFDEVFRVYNQYSAIGLMNMTHEETPWLSTPIGVGSVIAQDKMKSFFKGRLND